MAKKRRPFSELIEGFEAAAEERDGKRTLRTQVSAIKVRPDVIARELLIRREHMQVSRACVARCLRSNVRTLENFEHLQAQPIPRPP